MRQRAVPTEGQIVAGRYRIEALIGQGGFGAVYRATQVNLGRTVALKVVLPELLSQDDGLARFRREAQLAQRLTHPNTVRIYDSGESEGGAPFIVWEYLEGRSLDAALREEGALAPARVARIAAQILKSLMEAHGLGILHRDIKPANVFLARVPGEVDFVKVLDFGIAKSTRSGTLAQLTQAGQTVGTPSYMAPEQVLGDEVSCASDLYALGLLMAEALSGRRVYDSPSGVEVCMQQISEQPVPLPEAALRSALGPVIARATQKKPAMRYASAGEMLADLERLDPARTAAASAPPMTPAPLLGAGAVTGAYANTMLGATPQTGPAAFAQTRAVATPPGGPMPPAQGAFAHQPTAVAPAYGMASAPPPAPAPAEPSRAGLLVGLGVGGVGAAAAVVGVLYATGNLGGRPDHPGRDVGGQDRKPPRRAPASRPAAVKAGLVPGRRLVSTSPDQIAARITAAGYVIKQTSPSPTVVVWVITDRDEEESGSVELYRATDAVSAGIIAEMMEDRDDGVGVRDAGVFLWISLDDENAKARALLDALTTR